MLTYGGDHDDRATDYEFCGNGIVFADRKESPKAQEVKALYSNVKLTPTEEGVTVRNENLFITTGGYTFRYRLLRDGVCIFEKTRSDIAIPARSEAFVELDYPEQKSQESISLKCRCFFQKTHCGQGQAMRSALASM